MGNYHCCPNQSCGADLSCGELVQNPADCPVTTWACQTTLCCAPLTTCSTVNLNSCTASRFTQPECLLENANNVVCPVTGLNIDDNLVAVPGERAELDLDPTFRCCPGNSCGVQESVMGVKMAAKQIKAPEELEPLPTTGLNYDACLATEGHTKTDCNAQASSAMSDLMELVSPAPISILDVVVASEDCVAADANHECTNPAFPSLCRTGICCSRDDCSEGCFFGDFTEDECEAMPGMFVCSGLNKPGPIDYNNSPPGIGGDPHIQKWNHQWFDFHGECDLVLLDAPDFHHGMGMNIQVRTTMRYDYSYIEVAAIKIGTDVLQVSSWGSWWFNEISNGDLPSAVNHTVTNQGKQSRFEIKIGTNQETVVLQTFKDMVSVQVHHGNQEGLLNSVGLMGQFTTGAMVARDRVTILEDPVLFGQEWQVRDDEESLFVKTREPQYPTQCRMPSSNNKDKAAMHRRRLGEHQVSQEDAEEACSQKFYRASGEFKNCVFDTLASNDLELALAGPF